MSHVWIVTTQTYSCAGHPAMIVEADSEAEAAALGADWFTEHADFAEALPIVTVFVAPWSGRTAYRVHCAADPAELQCCGGGKDIEYVGAGGHWATCPERPPGTGQPCQEAADA